MFDRHAAVGLSLLGASWLALAQTPAPATLGELASPVQLSRDELLTLMPGARMVRINDKGNSHRWTNEPGGDMVVSSDNRSDGRASTARAHWHIDDQGRYCLSVQWKRGAEDDSCRYVLKAGGDYFAVESMDAPTRKLYRLEISR